MSVMITKTINRSGIITSAGTLLAANEARASYMIQNCGTEALFVKRGTGASITDFDFSLGAGTGDDDGNGGFYESPADQVYTGIITIAGTTPRVVASECEEE